MGFARRSGSSTTVTASGTLTLSQLDIGWGGSYKPATWWGSCSGPGYGKGSIRVDGMLGSSPGSNLYYYARSQAGGGIDADIDEVEIAHAWTILNPTPPPIAKTVWGSCASDYSFDYQAELGPLYVYTMKGYGLQKLVNPSLTSPTHPNHGWIADAWGTCAQSPAENSDTYTSLTTMGGASYETDPAAMQAGVDFDDDGVPIGGTGTSDLPPLLVTLGLLKPNGSVSGLVAEWTNLTYNGVAVDMPTLTCYDANGIRVEASGDTLSLYVDDWTSVPSGGASYTVTVYPWTGVEYGLLCYDFNTTYTGAEFSIPATDGSGGREAVANGYSDTVYYHKTSIDSPARSRLWMVAVNLDSDWLEEAGEDVDPSDAACTIEGTDLTGSDSWSGFSVRRDPEISLQCPADAGGTLPSAWAADDALKLVVTQTGTDTEVEVQTTASGNYITRTLVGTHPDAKTTKHAVGDDVRCVENYSHLRVDFTSDEPQTLTLTLTQAGTDYSWSVPVAGTGSPESVYLDLMLNGNPRLYDLRTLKLSGFTGASAAFDFVLHDLVAVAYNPTDAAEDGGRFDTKVVFPRVSKSAVPIHSVAATFTADGSRAIQLPATEACLFTEGGMEFINATPAMRTLAALWDELDAQEGIHCSGSTAPTVNGQSAYDAAFVDADDNDMLGGYMMAGDLKEQFDRALSTHASTYTTIPCAVRVGRVYLAAGHVTPVTVLKHIRGSIHGPLTNGGVRAGDGQTVTLWEWDGASWTKVGTTTTDDWSRFRFATGGRETDCLLRAIAGTNAPTGGGTQGYNELRRWIAEIIPPSARRVDMTRQWGDGTVWLVWDRWDPSEDVMGKRSPDGGYHWLPEEVLQSGGHCPSVSRWADGGACLTWIDDGEVLCSVWDGADWSAAMSLLTGYTGQSHDTVRFGGTVYVVALNESTDEVEHLRAHIVGGSVVAEANSLATVASADAGTVPVIAIGSDRSLWCSYITGGNVEVSVSYDDGATWAVAS